MCGFCGRQAPTVSQEKCSIRKRAERPVLGTGILPPSVLVLHNIISYQITAAGLFSLLPANSCFGLDYAQHYTLGVLRKLTWLVFVSYLMPYRFPMFI